MKGKNFNLKVLFRIVLAIIIFYVILESLARYRFEYYNPYMPISIRANMGLNSYDAMHFKRNFDKTSLKGIHYITDEYGFRHGGKLKDLHKPTVLLGGDSRIFGYSLKYKDTVSSLLEKSNQFNIYQQAYPGSSPALFNYGIFENGLYDKLKIAPNYIIYAYDRCDCYNDDVFEQELKENENGTTLRKLKLMLGGYAWNMCYRKLGFFMNQKKFQEKNKIEVIQNEENKIEVIQNEEDKIVPTQPKITDIPIRTSALNRLRNYSKGFKVPLIMLYLPRAEELYIRDSRVRDRLLKWTTENEVIFIDGYAEFDQLIQGELKKMEPFFIDLSEGIHFSPKGSVFISDLILKKLEELK